MRLIKGFVLWNYSRETSVYVIFCLLIVCFIFLTPKSWFERKERLATPMTRLIVQASDLRPDKTSLQQYVREISGNPDATVTDWRAFKNARGDSMYEIDIR